MAVKNRYLNLSAGLKLLTTQHEPKRAETMKCNPQPATVIGDQLFLTMSTSKPILAIYFLTE